MYLNLKAKFAVLTGALILVVAMLLTTFLTRQQARTIRDELLTRSVALTENLAYNGQLPIAAENAQSLHRLAQGLFKQADVSYVEFLDSNGATLHREGEGPGWPLVIVDVREDPVQPNGSHTAWITAKDGRTFLEVQTAVVVEAAEEGDILSTQRQTEDVTLGTVRVGFSTTPAQALIEAGRALGTMLGLIVALASSIVAAVIIHVMTRPLSQLMEGNRRVARGDFGLRLEVRARDEFGRLAGSYNQMADEIQRSRELADSYLASLRSNAEHLEEANRALQQSNAELAKASRMKSEFLAVMSHELRTPLNVIIGFSEVLLDKTFGDLNVKQNRYVENVHASGRHLLSLINDILDLSKVEAGRMQVTPEPIDLRQSLDEIQGLVRSLATKKNVTIEFGAVPTLTPVTDLKIFKQVLLNLLSNAIKFTPSGGQIRLLVDCVEGRTLRADVVSQSLPPERRLAIGSRRVLVVEVSDTGVGIAAEDREKVFQAFQQVDASYARRQEGTGLGLALTRKLVQLLGGDIWFESKLGDGTTFWFYLPFEYSEEAARADEEQAPLAYDATLAAGDDDAILSGWSAAADVQSGDVGIGTESALPHAQWPWGGEEPAAAAGANAGEPANQEGDGLEKPRDVAEPAAAEDVSEELELVLDLDFDPDADAAGSTNEPVGSAPKRKASTRKPSRARRPRVGESGTSGAPESDKPELAIAKTPASPRMRHSTPEDAAEEDR